MAGEREQGNVALSGGSLNTPATYTQQKSERIPDKTKGQQAIDSIQRSAAPTARLAGVNLNAKAKADVITQKGLASTGEPPRDATREGYQAYRDVQNRNTTINVVNDLKREAAQFEGSDVEWYTHSNNLIETYLSGFEYQEDANAAAQLFYDSAPTVSNIRASSKYKQRDIDNERQAVDSFRKAVTSGDNPDGNVDLVFEENEYKGMTEEQSRSAFVRASVTLANENDDRSLLFQSKRLGFFDEEIDLSNAMDGANQRILAKNAGYVANNKNEILVRLHNGYYSNFEDWSKAAQSQIYSDIPTWSNEQILQQWNSWNSGLGGKTDDYAYLFDDTFRRIVQRTADGKLGEANDPVDLSSLNPAKRKEFVTYSEDRFQDMRVQALNKVGDNGDSRDSVNEYYNKLQISFLEQIGEPSPRWQYRLEQGTRILYGDNQTITELPTNFKSGISLYHDLSRNPALLAKQLPNAKTRAVYELFDMYIQGGNNEIQAYTQAVNNAYSDKHYVFTDKEEEDKWNEETRDNLEESFGSKGFLFWKTNGASDAVMDGLYDEAQTYAKSLMKGEGRYVDTTVALNKGVEYVRSKYSVQLSDGQPLAVNEGQLQNLMGVSSLTDADVGLTAMKTIIDEIRHFSPEGERYQDEYPDLFENITVNVDELQEPDDWSIKVDDTKGTMQIIGSDGFPVTMRSFPLKRVGDVFRENQLDDIMKDISESVNKRNEDTKNNKYRRTSGMMFM